MFKQVTGFPCPSCGTTRSLQAIITGNFAGALTINPFGYLAAGFLLLFPFLVVYQLIAKKPVVVNSIQYFEKVLKHRTVAIILIVVVLANWYWNITKGL
jgi:hypothetical protein